MGAAVGVLLRSPTDHASDRIIDEIAKPIIPSEFEPEIHVITPTDQIFDKKCEIGLLELFTAMKMEGKFEEDSEGNKEDTQARRKLASKSILAETWLQEYVRISIYDLNCACNSILLFPLKTFRRHRGPSRADEPSHRLGLSLRLLQRLSAIRESHRPS